jgi:uncharacterized membrane protein YdfJ with MMPL/SSD domain
MKVLALIKNIIDIAAVIIWVVLFVVNRDVANGLLPLLMVLMFVNVDSKIGEIIRQLKEMK